MSEYLQDFTSAELNQLREAAPITAPSQCSKAGSCLRCNPLCSDACKRYDPTMQDEPAARGGEGREAFHVVLWILVSVIFSVYAGMVAAGNFEQLRAAVQEVLKVAFHV